MEKKVKSFIIENQMIQPGDGIVLGLSGGADSVCLFFLLLSLRQELSFRLVCVHVHHGLRGKAADEDEQYARTLCNTYDIPYRSFFYDVKQEAQKYGCSEEEMGRRLRYQSFEQVLNELSCNKIAVAHHMVDQAETVLYHLCRGSGLTGLTGMRPVAGNRIRPLLCLGKKEIIQYLTERQISWQEDVTNAELLYTRNRIRHQVLPCLTENINSASVEHIAASAAMLAEIEHYIEKQVSLSWENCAERMTSEVCLSLQPYRMLDIVIQKQLIFRAIEYLKKGRKDIQSVHLAMVLGLIESQTGKEVRLPDGIRVIKEYERIRFTCRRQENQTEMDVICLERPGVYSLPDETGALIISEPIPVEAVLKKEIVKNTENIYTKWFDYDKIKGTLQLRTRREGDYLEISEKCFRKKLKSYLINEKIPKETRDKIWLLADGSHILWVTGHRISEGYKITDNTKHAVRIEIKWR